MKPDALDKAADGFARLLSYCPKCGDRVAGNLRDLATEEIQLFQLVLDHNVLETVIGNFPGTDFDAYTCLLDLMRRGFVTFG